MALLLTIRKIAYGDLRTPVEVNGADEITDLQTATATMRLSLRNTIQHISDSSGQLASAAEEMSPITKESNAGIQRQSIKTDQAATAVNQMTAAVEEVHATPSLPLYPLKPRSVRLRPAKSGSARPSRHFRN
ncbi:HAMP domain-containing protein [Pseudomonas sp. CCI1.2]|uniref:HAMP domain-containing protein n=1 Tax=Pseudomonas sp. CCI1.2 TaxID=3048614 RepID=UPI003A5990D0